MEVGFLRSLACQLRYTSHRLTFPFGFFDLTLQYVGEILLVYVKVIIDICLNKVAYVLINSLSIGSHKG